MTALFVLASELLGPMLDPRVDAAEAAARSLSFDSVISRDPDLARQLTDPLLSAEDVDDAPTGVWCWWLDWRRATSEAPPLPSFLTALYDRCPDPLTRMRVVQAETWHPRWIGELAERSRAATPTLLTLPEGFVGDGLRRIAGRVDRGRRPTIRSIEPTDQALDPEEMATYLLQLGDSGSLAVLRALISAPWDGARDLRDRYGPLLEQPDDDL